MKAYMKVLIITLVASVCIGCKSKMGVDEQRIEIDANVEIDANDVVWATGWTVYKWKFGTLTSEPVDAIHLVVIGPDGEVKSEKEFLSDSGNPHGPEGFDPEQHLRIAFKREGPSSLLVKISDGTVSTVRTLDSQALFDGYIWSQSPDWPMAGDLKILASDGGPRTQEQRATTIGQMYEQGTRLCLRFLTRETSEAEITTGLASDQQAATPADLAAAAQVKQKLNHIRIRHVFMENLTLTECVDVFRRRAQKSDLEPDVNLKGVKIVIDAKPGEPDIGERRINSLELHSGYLGDRLKRFCISAGVAFKVDGDTVVIYDSPKN